MTILEHTKLSFVGLFGSTPEFVIYKFILGAVHAETPRERGFGTIY